MYSEIRLLMSYVSANIETMCQHLPEDWFGPMEIYVGLVNPLYIGATNEKSKQNQNKRNKNKNKTRSTTILQPFF